MDIFLISVTLLCLFATWISIARINGRKKKKDLNLPPGGMHSWPLIGDLLQFISPIPPTSLGSYMEGKIKRYGNFFKINVLGNPMLMSVDQDFNKFVLENDGKLFEHNLPNIYEKLFGKTLKEMIKGEEHRTLKNFMNYLLGVPRLQTHFLQNFEKYVLQTLRSWKEGVPFPAHEETKRLGFYMILKSIFNLEPGEQDMEELWRLYRFLVQGLTCLPIDMPGTTYRKALDSRKAIVKIIERIMKERIHKSSSNCNEEDEKESDYLDILLDRSDLPTEHLIDHMLGLLFAGFDPSSNALALAIYFLGRCHETLKQLKEEHEKIAKMKKENKEASLTWEHLKQMQFTHCVVKEVLRLGNISRHLYRKSAMDFQFKGYDIPSGWSVLPNFVAARLDETVFEEPHLFNPWRWQNVCMIPKMMKNYVAFGQGLHKCPGGDLMKMELCVFLHHLVLNYEWEEVVPGNPIWQFGVHQFSKDLFIKVRVVSKSS